MDRPTGEQRGWKRRRGGFASLSDENGDATISVGSIVGGRRRFLGVYGKGDGDDREGPIVAGETLGVFIERKRGEQEKDGRVLRQAERRSKGGQEPFLSDAERKRPLLFDRGVSSSLYQGEPQEYADQQRVHLQGLLVFWCSTPGFSRRPQCDHDDREETQPYQKQCDADPRIPLWCVSQGF